MLALLALASCGSLEGMDEARAADRAVTVGQSYASSGKASYDEVGYASWYGSELAGNRTGSGEAFDPKGVSAAHRTLPMGSFAEVTSLDTGRTILVRINDRGPVSKKRIIDLSEGAARLLGAAGQGTFPVRVRRVNPPEFEKKALSSGGMAAERLPTTPALLRALRKRLEQTTPGSPASAESQPPKSVLDMPREYGRYFIQIGAFSTEARAAAVARQVDGSVQAAGKYWRVRTGPYASEAAAKAALGPVAAKGYRDASIIR
jgi:rare lipoprotein A